MINLSFRIYANKPDPFFEAIIVNSNIYNDYFANKAVEYCRKVLNSPWPKAEKVIASSPTASYKYARYVLKKRWRRGEEVISRCSYSSYLYSRFVVKGRYVGGEKAISQWYTYSYWYAKNVLKGRFEVAEDAIASSRHAAAYAVNVLKKRWEVVEDVILQNATVEDINKYINMLRGKDRIDFHNKILAIGISDNSDVYWRKTMSKRWLERYGNDFVRDKN